MKDPAPLTTRQSKRIGEQATRTGLPAPVKREGTKVTTTRGADELLARAKEAELESASVDHATLSTIHDRLRNV